jgi:hypothetical protein
LLAAIACSFADGGRTAEALRALAAIPDECPCKLLVQMGLVHRLATCGRRADAQGIVETIEDETLRSLGRMVFTLEEGERSEEEVARRRRESLTVLLAMAKHVGSASFRQWVLMVSAPALAIEGRLDEGLAVAREIDSGGAGFRAMAEGLAHSGRVVDALERDRALVAVAAQLSAVDVEHAEAEEILSGIHTLLRSARARGRAVTCRVASHLVALLPKLVDPERRADLIWQTYERIAEVETGWHSSQMKSATAAVGTMGGLDLPHVSRE